MSKPEFADIIKSFWNIWKSTGGDIRFGTVGFSAGFKFGDKRIPIQFVYLNRLSLISNNYLKSYDIPDSVYMNYKESLRSKVPKAFDHLIANHVTLYFTTLTKDELSLILNATVEVAQEMKGK